MLQPVKKQGPGGQKKKKGVELEAAPAVTYT